MEQVIKVNHLSKRFKDTAALSDVSFEIEKGEIFGYLGPSGAGKTTTIKLLSGQLRTESGEISLFGKSPFDTEIRDRIGIMSDNSGLYDKMTVYENLKLFADLYQVSRDKIDEVLHRIGMEDAAKKPCEKLSKGMRQRLTFARTILHNPEILFLDEPTANLDPATAEEVRSLILQMKEHGTTVFLTTHNMEEANELCDRIAFLNCGKIIECGSPYDLKLKYAKKQVKVTTASEEVILPLEADRLSSYLAGAGEIKMIHSIEPSLKEVFLALTEEGGRA